MDVARVVLAAILLGGLAAPASAAPLATLSADVDGDGAPDAIELGADGVVRIAAQPRGEVRLAPSLTSARLAVSRYRGVAYVVARIVAPSAIPGAPRGAALSEAVILSSDGSGWREVMRFAVGGVGLDHDYGVEVDAAADGIYRYQTRGDIRRCDGAPAYLFAEKFDGARFRRASALPSRVADNAPLLTARRDPAPALPPLLYKARAASLQPGATDAGALAIPRELDDGKLDTLWREELAASAGEGQFFTFEPRAESTRARQLRIVPGNPASQAAMRAVNRPRRIAIVSAQAAWRTELPDAAADPLGSAYVVELPEPVAGCITVVLESTYGPPQGATAIAELELFADGERAGGGDALLAQVVAGGGGGAVTAAAAFAHRGAAGAAAIESQLATTTQPAARRRLIGALAQIRDPAAGPALAQAAAGGWLRDRDLLDVIRALGAIGRHADLRELAANSAIADDARAAAVAQIPASSSSIALIIELAGDGPAEVRRAVIEQLSAAPLDALLAAVGVLPPAAAGDVWRAIARSARHTPSQRPSVLAAMLAALPTATDYERRYRLADGIAALGDAAALRTLDESLRALPASAETFALRQVALRAIGAAPRPDALGFALDGSRHTDAGVRLAALSALAAAEPWGDRARDPIDRAIGSTIATDRWPEVRRRAATALASRCQRPGPARALLDTVELDRDLAVRTDALSALVQCRAAGIAQLLPTLWTDAKQPIALRTHAVQEAVPLADPTLALTLVQAFERWRADVASSHDALALAQAAAASIGRLRAPGAARALLDTLDHSSFPELVQAAALGLGALGPACPAEARAKLTQIAHSDAPTSIAARRAAAQCGR